MLFNEKKSQGYISSIGPNKPISYSIDDLMAENHNKLTIKLTPYYFLVCSTNASGD